MVITKERSSVGVYFIVSLLTRLQGPRTGMLRGLPMETQPQILRHCLVANVPIMNLGDKTYLRDVFPKDHALKSMSLAIIFTCHIYYLEGWKFCTYICLQQIPPGITKTSGITLMTIIGTNSPSRVGTTSLDRSEQLSSREKLREITVTGLPNDEPHLQSLVIRFMSDKLDIRGKISITIGKREETLFPCKIPLVFRHISRRGCTMIEQSYGMRGMERKCSNFLSTCVGC